MLKLSATILILLAATYLHRRGVQKGTKDDKNIFYYDNGDTPDPEAYVKLLKELRSRLASGTDAHGIAVTRPSENVPVEERFIQVQLNKSKENTITVIIDTVNVYVVGYLNGTLPPILYYLNDIPEKELYKAFRNMNHTNISLGFPGNYDKLPNRRQQKLGHGALNNAIDSLYYQESQESKRRALLVIIQMVAEAVRIRYIEHLILRNMREQYHDFTPDLRAMTMENQWSKLSNQIQYSGESGVFKNTIEVPSALNESIKISNVQHVMSQAALALMLYPSDPKRCPNVEPATNIIGRDGQCVDVKDNQYNNGNAIILWACGYAQPNQLWTFKSDGTIRSNGKCLTANTSSSDIMIYDCDTAVPEATKWILHVVGTIMNPKSGLVIAAETSTQGTVLKVAEDNNSSRQAWSAGNYTQPTKNYISGFHEKCLQAYSANASVLLEHCVIGTNYTSQHWALYGDSTIRLYSNRTLCVTSNGNDSMDLIILSKCQGKETQRWTFMADGTILNPNARLVMDVWGSKIVLKEPTGNPNQSWMAF